MKLLILIGFYFGAIDYTTTANSGLRNVIYYADWSVWEGQQNDYPDQIAADQITHLNFAFMDFDSNGNLILTDSGASYDNPCGHSGVTWGDPNAGVLPAFQNLRANYPNLRLGVSLGGWSKSGDFTAALSNNASRANLVNQLVKFVEYNNLDFIDIDWEYPGTVREPDLCDNSHDEGTPHADISDGKLFIQFLEDLKAKENEMGKRRNRIYELTVALPTAVSKLENGAQAYLPPNVTLETATPEQLKAASSEYITLLFDTVDFGNLMTYDLRGAWDYVSGHHTGLYTHLSGNVETDAVGYSIDGLVSYLLGKDVDSLGNKLNHTIDVGVPPEKLVIGSAFYSRGWGKVSNNGPERSYPGLFGTASVSGRDADQADSPGAENALPIIQGDGGRLGGVWPYGRFAELHSHYPGLKYFYDDIAEAPYLYNEDSGAFFTYDSPRSIAAKTKYVRKNGLGGCISWVASMDANTGDEETGQYGPGQVRNVLSKAIKTGLWGDTPLDEFNIGAVQTNVSCVITMGKNVNNGQPVYSLEVKNTFVNSESTDCLQRAARVAGTLAVPKLIITVKDGVYIGNGSSYGSGTWTQEGNVVTDDLTTTYELRFLDPGETASIALPAAGEGASVADIVTVEIARSIYPDGKEVGRVLIYP